VTSRSAKVSLEITVTVDDRDFLSPPFPLSRFPLTFNVILVQDAAGGWLARHHHYMLQYEQHYNCIITSKALPSGQTQLALRLAMEHQNFPRWNEVT